ncbi:MAG: hypothetical protein EOM15_07530 [Spirochaetia bacterium]|nr:hypothetical protein [Spirochaetia bacterium]
MRNTISSLTGAGVGVTAGAGVSATGAGAGVGAGAGAAGAGVVTVGAGASFFPQEIKRALTSSTVSMIARNFFIDISPCSSLCTYSI